MSEVEREKYLDDGLHLTVYGYDTLGRYIFNALTSVWCTTGPQTPVLLPMKSGLSNSSTTKAGQGTSRGQLVNATLAAVQGAGNDGVTQAGMKVTERCGKLL